MTYLIICGFSIISLILCFFIEDTIDYNKYKKSNEVELNTEKIIK